VVTGLAVVVVVVVVVGLGLVVGVVGREVVDSEVVAVCPVDDEVDCSVLSVVAVESVVGASSVVEVVDESLSATDVGAVRSWPSSGAGGWFEMGTMRFIRDNTLLWFDGLSVGDAGGSSPVEATVASSTDSERTKPNRSSLADAVTAPARTTTVNTTLTTRWSLMATILSGRLREIGVVAGIGGCDPTSSVPCGGSMKPFVDSSSSGVGSVGGVSQRVTCKT